MSIPPPKLPIMPSVPHSPVLQPPNHPISNALLRAPGHVERDLTPTQVIGQCVGDLRAIAQVAPWNVGRMAKTIGEYIALPATTADAPVPYDVIDASLLDHVPGMVAGMVFDESVDTYALHLAVCRQLVATGATVHVGLADGAVVTAGALFLVNVLAGRHQVAADGSSHATSHFQLLVREILAGIAAPERARLKADLETLKSYLAGEKRPVLLQCLALMDSDELTTAAVVAQQDAGDRAKDVQGALRVARDAATATNFPTDLAAVRAAVDLIAQYGDASSRVVLLELRRRAPAPTGWWFSDSKQLRKAIDAALVQVEARNTAQTTAAPVKNTSPAPRVEVVAPLALPAAESFDHLPECLRPVDLTEINVSGIALKVLQGGIFVRGSHRYSDAPPTWCQVDPFTIGVKPVTEAQFEAVTGTRGRKESHAQMPVTLIKAAQADDFCQRIGLRVPTEAEHEFAMLGGPVDVRRLASELGASTRQQLREAMRHRNIHLGNAVTALTMGGAIVADLASEQFATLYQSNNDIFAWRVFATVSGGNESSIWINKREVDLARVDRAGASRNAYGLVDAVGNVLEWCADQYDPKSYATLPHINPQQRVGQYRVARGLSRLSPRIQPLVAHRSFNGIAHHDVGVRAGGSAPELRVLAFGY